MNSKRGDSWCHMPDYSNHTVEETNKGVTIKIYTHGGNVHEYICEDKTKIKGSEWVEGYQKWKKNQDEEVYGQQEQKELNASYKQSLANRKERCPHN